MDMSYEQIQQLSGLAGLALFTILFAIVLFMAYRPGAKAAHDEHARIPFQDEE